MTSRYSEIDLSGIRTVSIKERGGLVRVESFVSAAEPDESFDRIVDSFPDILAGADFRAAVDAVARVAEARGTVVLMFGAHVIKCGLSRLVIDLIERGIVSAVATNGAGAIHDAEIAMWGMTSEDVAANLANGTFGTCRETAEFLNGAADEAAEEEAGFGETVGRRIAEREAPHRDASIFGRAWELGVPATVHVALGTDIVHEHASAHGAAIGDASLRDFRILADVVSRVDGGAVINVGSAVILPEVFLKALAVGRNLGRIEGSFTALSLDMNEPYRTTMNVVRRPTAQSGMGFALRGRHEMLLPLFRAALLRALATGGEAPESR
ncbi:MAG: hypothetical protein GF405_10345 [Candidatus Eisenbacteria bacterium]|nr:hypothetical protein [Candidatus Eisenbacteria bacterium]